MKTDLLILLAAAGCLLSLQDCFSQSGASADAKVSERGPHSRVWERIAAVTNELGQVAGRMASGWKPAPTSS